MKFILWLGIALFIVMGVGMVSQKRAEPVHASNVAIAALGEDQYTVTLVDTLTANPVALHRAIFSNMAALGYRVNTQVVELGSTIWMIAGKGAVCGGSWKGDPNGASKTPFQQRPNVATGYANQDADGRMLVVFATQIAPRKTEVAIASRTYIQRAGSDEWAIRVPQPGPANELMHLLHFVR